MKRARSGPWITLVIVLALAGGGYYAYSNHYLDRYLPGNEAAAALPSAPPPAQVLVSTPVERELDTRLGFLGQFSAADQVELRAQVGGTLTAINFKDGDVVKKGDPLFNIDPVPYQIKLAQATAALETATAKVDLANRELERAVSLNKSAAGTVQNLDQRKSDQQTAQASVDDAKAQIRDAQFDLDHCSISAPFTGRIGNHLVSVGSLVSGSRAGASATTLLTTLVSLDPVYLDFDMSESDYLTFSRDREKTNGQLAEKIEIALSDEDGFSHQGTLDFVDNVINRSSGTLHARATVPNSDLLLTSGEFARVRLTVGTPIKTLLVPDAAVIPDQSERVVMTVSDDNTVVAKIVKVGDIRGGLRVIRSGLASTDKVIIQGASYAAPGSKVAPKDGAIRFAETNGKD